MGGLGRHRWFAAAGGVSLAFAGVCLTAHRSAGLTAFSDIFVFAAMLVAGGIMVANAMIRPGRERWFWGLMAAGLVGWTFNQGTWVFCEVVLRKNVPDPYFADIILFFHLIPMIAAVAWSPHQLKQGQRFHLSTLNFLMLLVWWMFLYAFLVFPDQYVTLNVASYDQHYLLLYQVQHVLLITLIGLAAWRSSAPWRRLYLNFFVACALYLVSSQLTNAALASGRYYSGSWYDVPLVAAISWMAATALTARQWQLEAAPAKPEIEQRAITPRLAMLAILSLPVLGLWTFLFDRSPEGSRVFRLFTVLAAMVVLGAFVFLRQYLQDQALMRLLDESRSGYENQERLQSHLVQKEKLASLGHLVAGAAHEIDHPLTAIMTYSEQLWSNQRLTDEQDVLVRKIVNQAKRTRDLVSDLLSFAQESPAEKTLVDVAMLVQRSILMLELQRRAGGIRAETFIDPELPLVWGNANQLFQAFVQIVENAVDALAETGGGSLHIIAQRQTREVVIQFSDTGSGIREPQRVFDPFYTTKPIGKGTGLGLSAVYGVIQDHKGQITCQNKPEGGALFVLRLPVATDAAIKAVAARA